MVKKFWLVIILGILILVGALIISSQSGKVSKNDTVTIHYTLTLEDGTVYDSTIGREPITTALGQGLFIASFEEQLIGMRPGEFKSFTLPPERAFGFYRTDLIGTVERSWLPESVEPKVGKRVETEFIDGTPVIAVIKDFDDTSITLDANHPLAGQSLTFEIRLMAIDNQATDQSARNWFILALVALTALAAFILISRRNRRALMTTQKSARAFYSKKQHRVQYK